MYQALCGRMYRLQSEEVRGEERQKGTDRGKEGLHRGNLDLMPGTLVCGLCVCVHVHVCGTGSR